MPPGSAIMAMSSSFERCGPGADRKSTRLNSSHRCISYAVFCLKKKNNIQELLGNRAKLTEEPHREDREDQRSRERCKKRARWCVSETGRSCTHNRRRLSTHWC